MVRINRRTPRSGFKTRRMERTRQDRFDKRYERVGSRRNFTEGYLVPIVNRQPGTSSIRNDNFVTVGDRRGTLPGSVPVSFLPTDCSPDDQAPRELGNFKNMWAQLWTKRFTLRKSSSGPQVSFDYDQWLNTIGHKLGSNKVVLDGYGATAAYNSNNAVSINIERPVFNRGNGTSFTFDPDVPYTRIDRWAFNGWWSPTDINSNTGIGIIRDCVDNASPMNPGVEFEVADTGNDNFIYCRFRNFYSHRVVVGVRIIA